MWAICKATLRAIFKSPQAIFFSLFFPIVLIMVFGALAGGGGKAFDIAIDAKSDTLNPVYFLIKSNPLFDINQASEEELLDRLKKGRITAMIQIKELPSSTNVNRSSISAVTPPYSTKQSQSSTSSAAIVIPAANAARKATSETGSDWIGP